MTLEDTVELILEHIPLGGVTISKEGKVLTSGIAVGLNPYYEYHIPAHPHQLYERAVSGWLRMINNQFNIGMWTTPDGTIVLDIVEVFSKYSIMKATNAAKNTGQLSIYLLDTNTTLWIEYDDHDADRPDRFIKGSPVRQPKL